MCRRGRKGDWYPEYFDDDYLPRRAEIQIRIKRTVLNASQALLKEVGPRAFTVKEAARRAGVGRTTVYKYFGLKADLLAACRADAAARGSRRIQWSAMAARVRADRARAERVRAERASTDRASTERASTERASADRARADRANPGRPTGLPRSLEVVHQAMLALVQHMHEEADLFLLAAAEGLRSKRRPRERVLFYGTPEGPDPRTVQPLPLRYMRTVTSLLEEAAQKGEIRAGIDPGTASLWLGALWWHALCTRGPSADGWQDRVDADAEQMLRALAAG